MLKEFKGRVLLSVLMVLAMLLCSFPVTYAEETDAEIPAEEMTAEVFPAAEEKAVSVQEPAPKPEPVSEPVFVPESGAEPASAVTEEKPAAEPEPAWIPEEKPAEENKPGSEKKAVQEDAGEGPEDCLCMIDDEDAGFISAELLGRYNNLAEDQKAGFTGSVDIEMKEGEVAFGRDVTLVAKVSGAGALDYSLVWEANDGDGSGWHAVGAGSEYTFLLTRGNADREYRVLLFTAD